MAPERTCSDCRAPLPADAPRGLCPNCLMGAALSRPYGTGTEPGDDATATFQPAGSSGSRMLSDLAEHHLRSGGKPGEAIRALEAALVFKRTPELEARLKELYTLYSGESQRTALPSIIVFPLVIAVSAVIGLVAGMLNDAAGSLFTFLGDSVPTVIALMTWIPFVLVLVVTVMLIGLIGFNFSVHIPPPEPVNRDEDDTGPVSVRETVSHG